MAVKAVPDGFGTVTAHLCVSPADKAIEFYKKAFGAEEICRMTGPGGEGVMHAELQIGNSRIMVHDEFPGEGYPKTPKNLGGTSAKIHLYLEDVDSAYKKAVDAGAKDVMPPMDAFWGDRYGSLMDPFGHAWGLATHTKDMTPEEMEKAQQEWMASMSG